MTTKELITQWRYYLTSLDIEYSDALELYFDKKRKLGRVSESQSYFSEDFPTPKKADFAGFIEWLEKNE